MIATAEEGRLLKLELSFRGLVLLAAAALAIWALIEIWAVILLVITAVIFMAALLPYVTWLVRRGWRRSPAVLTILFLVLLAIAGLFALFVPAMIDEFEDIRDNLPEYAADLEDLLDNFGIDVELQERARDIDWGELISGRAAIDYGQQALFFLISTITVIVLTAYLLADAPKMKAYFFRFIPPARHEEATRVLNQLERVVGGYIRGQLITSAIIGAFTFIVLLSVGVPNAIAFGVLAAFADAIPLIGAFIAIVPATLAAFTESPTQAFIVLGLLLVYQQFEDRFLVPRVYGQTLGLQPLVVLIAVLVGAELLGIPGILLALPAAAAGKVALDLYLEKRSGEETPTIRETEEVAAPDPEAGPATTRTPDVTRPGEGSAG
jgi:predicted PurR-regulated permease PerM